ncbi:uncharacterized protein LOC135133018 [Zophobas morio]|uniref:uncharacterized protein LOC135133018 n=1 Tax=Zophobas morio TaxID=2755281 RepID=UPI00308277C3
MSKVLMGLFLCVCVMHKALCLTCYTVNFTSWLSGNVHRLKHKLQECSDYINEVSSVQGPTITGKLQCFTITSDYLDVVLKGCVPEGHCDSMIKAFQQMIEKSEEASIGAVGNADCKICEEDGCNSEDEETFYLPNNISTLKTTTFPRLKVVTTASTHSCCSCLKTDYSTCLFFIVLYYYSLHYG